VRRRGKKYLCAQFSNAAPGKAPAGSLTFLFDDNFELRGDAVDQFHVPSIRHNLDGLIERDAALIDLETLRGERSGEIRGSDRSKQLVRFTGLPRELDGDVIEQAACCSAAPFRLPCAWRA